MLPMAHSEQQRDERSYTLQQQQTQQQQQQQQWTLAQTQVQMQVEKMLPVLLTRKQRLYFIFILLYLKPKMSTKGVFDIASLSCVHGRCKCAAVDVAGYYGSEFRCMVGADAL
jgi:hypothetical protein